MFKMPEPAYLYKHEDVCGDEVGPPTPYYIEAQLKQAVRDAYEDAAKECEDIGQKSVPATDAYVAKICAKETRKLKEGL